MTWNSLKIDYKDEEPPVEAVHKDSVINIKLDGTELRTRIRVPIESALELADKIRVAAGEKDFEILEGEILLKDAKIEKLQDLIDQYNENNDVYREKITLSSGPF